MVSPSTALRAQAALCAAFWMGMTAFPAKLTSAYALDFFDCPKAGRGAAPCSVTNQKIMAFQCFSLFGIQILFWGIVSIALARPTVSEKAQSVACFSATCIWIFFLVNDFLSLMDPEWPEELPKEAQYGNLVMWAGFAALMYSAWKESGSVMPSTDVKTLLLPSGQFGTAITVLIGVNLMWGLPVCFLRQAFIDSFTQGFMDGFSPLIKKLVFAMMGQFGKMMLCNAFNLATIASVGDEDAQYRMLRAISVAYMFYLGSFSKDVLVGLAIDYENPGHAFMWFLDMAIFYYTSNAWAKAPYTLKKSK